MSPGTSTINKSLHKPNYTKISNINYKNDKKERNIEPMIEEYGDINGSTNNFQLNTSFELENGQVLHDISINYATYGTLNKERDNVLVICHALTGNAAIHTWWGNLLGPYKALDTTKYFCFCANVLGSCYGTTGPTSINKETNKPYGLDFPSISIRDTVRLHKILLFDHLNVKQIQCVIGGSMGGMQALEWAYFGKNLVKSIIPIACGSHHSAWQIAFNEVQRNAITLCKYQNSLESPNYPGLALARKIAMISYRTSEAYAEKYGRNRIDDQKSGNYEILPFQVQSYLEYQGQKFLQRFDENSYMCLLDLIDTHDVSRNRANSYPEALEMIEQPTLIIGIETDVLYPISQQKELNNHIKNSKLIIISSLHGHDGFLLEQRKINIIIQNFLDNLNLCS